MKTNGTIHSRIALIKIYIPSFICQSLHRIIKNCGNRSQSWRYNDNPRFNFAPWMLRAHKSCSASGNSRSQNKIKKLVYQNSWFWNHSRGLKNLRIKSFLYWFESRMMLKIVKYFRPEIRYFVKDTMEMDLIGGKDKDIDMYSYPNRGGISIKAPEYWVKLYWDKHEHPKRLDFEEEGNLKRYGNSEIPRVFYSYISVNTLVLNGKFDTFFTQEDSKVFLKHIKKEFLVFYEDDYELDHGVIFFCAIILILRRY